MITQTSRLTRAITPLAGSDLKACTIQAVLLLISVWGCFLYFRFHVSNFKYPGPWLAKLSGWPNWYHAAKGDRHQWLHQQHVRYGPVVQFAPNAISIDTIEGRDAVYRSPTANVQKADWYQTVRDSSGGFLSTFTARDRAQHSIKRRLLSHAFSESAVKDYEPRIVNRVRKWVDILETKTKNEEQEIDMGSWSTFLIFDILGELCFGKTLGLMDSPEQRDIMNLVPETTKFWYTLGNHPLTKPLRYIIFETRIGQLVASRIYGNNARFRAFCLSKFQERSKRGSSAKGRGVAAEGLDVFDYLLHGRDSDAGHTYTVGDMACETVLLMVAGTQSASCALSSTIFYLVNNPVHLSKLENEVRRTFATEDDIRYVAAQELTMLPILRACLEESIRLTPPTPGHLPREVKVGGLEIGQIHLASGMDVGSCAYAMHRNPAYFENPSEFCPDRWMNDQRQESMRAFQAFSAGPTGCIGRNLAYMELSIAIALLVWRFDMRISSPAGNRAEYKMQDQFVGVGKGPVIQLLSRT